MKRRSQIVLLAISLLLVLLWLNYGRNMQTKDRRFKIESKLSPNELSRFLKMLEIIMRGSENVTPELHSEFWSLIDQNGTISEEELARWADSWQSMSVAYQRLFWTDALQSVKSARPYKSALRESFEKNKLAESSGGAETRGWEKQFRDNDQFMTSLAAKEAITTATGETKVYNENEIQELLGQLEDRTLGIKILMNRKYMPSHSGQ